MIDSHCHLDLPAFEQQQVQILRDCAAKGISRILVPGLTNTQFMSLLTLQSQCALQAPGAQIDIALGLHPYYLERLNDTAFEAQIQTLYELANTHPKRYVAIGECGLDGSINLAMDYQQKVLNAQIELATVLKKPLILHHRQSHNMLIKMLKQHDFKFGGVIHAFSGSQQIAQTYIDLGFALGVGGTITYARAIKTRATISNISLSHLLLETDAPDMPIAGFQGQINTPIRLPLIAQALADLQKTSITEVVKQTDANYLRIFTN